MKGLMLGLFCLLSLASGNAESATLQRVIELKTSTGLIFKNLNLRDSSNVLESLRVGETIEIGDNFIYPEEVSELKVGKLTNVEILAKRPNPNDYN